MCTLNITFCTYVSYKTYMAHIEILECSNILAAQENKRACTVCIQVNVYFHVERWYSKISVSSFCSEEMFLPLKWTETTFFLFIFICSNSRS